MTPRLSDPRRPGGRPAPSAARRGVAALTRLASRASRAHAAIAVCALAIAVLAVSQFADLQQVRAGAAEYADLAGVAPAPVVESQALGPTHGWAGLVLAGLAAGVLALAVLRGRWRLTRLLAPLGLAAVAMTLIVDLPRGMAEGELAATYADASAVLGPGFWGQLVAALALIVLGPITTARLRPAPARPLRSSRSATPPHQLELSEAKAGGRARESVAAGGRARESVAAGSGGGGA